MLHQINKIEKEKNNQDHDTIVVGFGWRIDFTFFLDCLS